MTARPPGSYASPMDSSGLAEQAALVALLRTRPGNLEVTPQTAASEIQRWDAEGYRLVSILDPEYPARLRGIQQAPPVLFALGAIAVNDLGVSVVGSREASPQGIAMAAELAREFVARKLTVVSGLARGIDTVAHQAALEVDGRTVAVIGTDAPPQKQNFLMRNATMSGYGLATVVVEAGEHSGARTQARLAVEHGRHVVLTDQVVARTQWAQDLLGRPGVHVGSGVSSVLDIVEHLLTMWEELQRLVAS